MPRGCALPKRGRHSLWRTACEKSPAARRWPAAGPVRLTAFHLFHRPRLPPSPILRARPCPCSGQAVSDCLSPSATPAVPSPPRRSSASRLTLIRATRVPLSSTRAPTALLRIVQLLSSSSWPFAPSSSAENHLALAVSSRMMVLPSASKNGTQTLSRRSPIGPKLFCTAPTDHGFMLLAS